MSRVRKTQLHQRNQTLAASQQLGIVAKLSKYGGRFL
jgi:hypothetical protein